MNDTSPNHDFAAAAAMNRLNPHDEELAAEFLKAQIELTRTQQASMLGDAALNTENLARQIRYVQIQHRHEGLRIALDVAFIALMVGIVLAGAALIWQAAASRSVVIEPFDVPPYFEAKGLTAKVVASRLLDRLQALKDATRTTQAKRQVRDAWSGDIEVRIPQANISIGELQRYLHRWLGNDAVISGDVVQTASGVALTVRGAAFPAKSFEGKLSDLPKLLTTAAEYTYGQSEPYLFSRYLTDNGRDAEAISIIKNNYLSAPESDRPLLLNLWGNALVHLGRSREALDKFSEAIRLSPDYWAAYANLMDAHFNLGEEEASLQTGLQMERAANRGSLFAKDVRSFNWQNLDSIRQDIQAMHREQVGDLAESNGLGTIATDEWAQDAQFLAAMHDPGAAEHELEIAGDDASTLAQAAAVRGQIAYDRGDYKTALKQFKYVDEQMTKSTAIASELGTSTYCSIALAEEMTGNRKAADADIARGGHFVDCYRFKADILDHRGLWREAEAAYVAAVKLAPSLPNAYDGWGQALMRHGNAQGAVAKFMQAHERGPHWADPLEHAGEAEAKVGHYREAADRFAEAAKYAPSWATLYLQWGRALDKAGKHDEALVAYRQAWALDLTPAERRSIYGCCH